MFVMATIYSRAESVAVKVRDMSSGGALIEAAAVPAVGTRVRLVRGSHEAMAHVVWSRGGRAGLRFDGAVSANEWMMGARSIPHQQRVDEMVDQARHSLGSRTSKAATTALLPSQVTASDILELKRSLESLAEDLCEDDSVVFRHASRLQVLDLASQLLSKLAAER